MKCLSVCLSGSPCELPAGHRGQCRHTYQGGQQEWWPRNAGRLANGEKK